MAGFEVITEVVWHSYLSGSGGALDLSQPNNMSIAADSFLGARPCGRDGVFLNNLSQNFIVPETFVRSPQLAQIF
jgi:hypothetical protein